MKKANGAAGGCGYFRIRATESLRFLSLLFVLAGLLAVYFAATSFAEDVTYTCLDDDEDGVVLVDAAGDGECLTIQEAIDAASGGEVIEVVDGDYEENLSVSGKALTIRSVSDDPTLVTINGTSIDRVLNITSGGGVDLQGVTLTRGYGTTGAALYVNNGSLTVSNCIFDDNNATGGGGAISIYQPTDDVLIEKSIFKDNYASGSGGAMYTDYFEGHALTIQNNLFYDNEANGDAGAIYFGINVYPKIYNNTFAYNEADSSGGAIYLYSVSEDFDLTNNIFYENDASPTVQATDSGDAVYMRSYFSAGTISYNDCYGNSEKDFYVKTSGKNCSAVGNNNLDLNPTFTDAAGRDLTLTENSDLIDAGYDLTGVVDEDITGKTRPLGEGYDIGAYEYGEEEVEEEVCTAEWAPVCGEIDGVYETYGNACEAEVAGATNVTDGECEEEEEYTFCTLEWAPVCGEVDGVFTTYGNQCAADADGATNITEGECPEVDCGDFPDVDSADFTSEQCAAIEWSQNEDIFTGNDDTGNLEADSPINRAETTKVLVETYGYEISDMPTSYSDVEEDAWYTTYIMTATDNGIVEGYDDGTFRPSNTVNKVEMLKIVLETAEVDLSEVDISQELFTDIPVDESTEWFRAYAYYAYENGLVDVDSDEFGAGDDILREDVILVLYRLGLM